MVTGRPLDAEPSEIQDDLSGRPQTAKNQPKTTKNHINNNFNTNNIITINNEHLNIQM